MTWRPYENSSQKELVEAYEKQDNGLVWWVVLFCVAFYCIWRFCGLVTFVIISAIVVMVIVLLSISSPTSVKSELRKEIERRKE